jgi:hypothetical protein
VLILDYRFYHKATSKASHPERDSAAIEAALRDSTHLGRTLFLKEFSLNGFLVRRLLNLRGL